MHAILENFQRKILSNSLSQTDFADASLFLMFSNQAVAPLLQIIASCKDPVFEKGEDKFIYHIPMGGEWEVRLDFLLEDNMYRLACMDGYTIPLKHVDQLPFHEYTPLPNRESIMREEYRVSAMVRDYVRLVGMIGKRDALDWFKDGVGEKAGVPAWMPYFTRRKAFIAYTAWMQNRLYGEDVVITKFAEEQSELLFRNHSWLFLYHAAAHIKQIISYEDYLELFETIWRDRAFHTGLQMEIAYEGNDIRMSFSTISDENTAEAPCIDNPPRHC